MPFLKSLQFYFDVLGRLLQGSEQRNRLVRRNSVTRPSPAVCQQSWDEYPLSDHPHLRNWWPLFWQLISASISNTLYLYRLKGVTEKEITHLELQERLGLQLIKNPSAVSRNIDCTSLTHTDRPTLARRPTNEHTWSRGTRRECVVCKPSNLFRRRGQGWRRRTAFEEIGTNATQLKKRKRGKQTIWQCAQCGVALCHRDSYCWGRHHGEIPYESEEDDDGAGSEDMDIDSQSDDAFQTIQ
jgi:hypothetical protein